MPKIVFATTTTTVSTGPGKHTIVHEGEHWLAVDPIVQAHPGLFTKDERRGLCSSIPIPEDDDEQEGPAVDDAWAELIRQAAKAGIAGADVLVVAKDSPAGRAAVAAGNAAEKQAVTDDEVDADARESQAPVEQATKAPGEKSNARRGTTRRG